MVAVSGRNTATDDLAWLWTFDLFGHTEAASPSRKQCCGVDPVSCLDGDVCTELLCDAGVCPSEPSDLPCSDGDLFTEFDACVGGECAAGDPLSCVDGNDRTEDMCDPVFGREFIGSSELPCDDGNPCAADVCEAETAACVSSSLPDGFPCPGGTCSDGACE